MIAPFLTPFNKLPAITFGRPVATLPIELFDELKITIPPNPLGNRIRLIPHYDALGSIPQLQIPGSSQHNDVERFARNAR